MAAEMTTARGLTAAAVLWLIASCVADTPANCTYYDVEGVWELYETPRGNDNSVDCSSHEQEYVRSCQFILKFPSLAVDCVGNQGFWTLIYNQGFEVVLGGRKYFMFLDYDGNRSICNHSIIGWSHNLNNADWACVSGVKYHAGPFSTKPLPPRVGKETLRKGAGSIRTRSRPYVHNEEFIRKINRMQNDWRATRYSVYETFTLDDLVRRSGGPRSRITRIPKRAVRPTEDLSQKLKTLPDAFDWRQVNGVNYISPVRDQGTCGSCYAFASMALIEARQRVYSNNTIQNVYSTQDVVECSRYSQGCAGGFPYLVAGKYGEDFGVVAESCNPYKGVDGPCSTALDCPRQYTYNYAYIGGYYGACSEEAMRLALVRDGPIAVSFEVYNDFIHYSGGVYYHTDLEDHFNPFEITNHVVLIVGYGTDPVAGDFWIVKNSWGTSWGENGYFRIRRGADECSIESIAVEVKPVI